MRQHSEGQPDGAATPVSPWHRAGAPDLCGGVRVRYHAGGGPSDRCGGGFPVRRWRRDRATAAWSHIGGSLFSRARPRAPPSVSEKGALTMDPRIRQLVLPPIAAEADTTAATASTPPRAGASEGRPARAGGNALLGMARAEESTSTRSRPCAAPGLPGPRSARYSAAAAWLSPAN